MELYAECVTYSVQSACFSCSQADEYVVYSPHQQRMRYLVEFSLPDEDSPVTAGEIDESSETSETGEARMTTPPTGSEEDVEAVHSEGIQAIELS